MASDATSSRGRVVAIVLAAGLGRRMGGARPKYAIELAGRPLLEHVADALAGSRVERTWVVLRPGDDAGVRLAASLGLESTFAESADEGRAASVRAGVRAAGNNADALLFCLADQPFLRAGDLDRLIEAWSRTPGSIVHASYAGERGTPVLFDTGYRAALLELHGRDGGRAVIERYRSRALAVELDPAVGRDLDRPEDLDSI